MELQHKALCGTILQDRWPALITFQLLLVPEKRYKYKLQAIVRIFVNAVSLHIITLVFDFIIPVTSCVIPLVRYRISRRLLR